MKSDVIERVRKFMELKNLNESELAKQIHISQRTVNNYMTENRKVSYEFIHHIVSSFELNANWLLTGDGPMYNTEKATLLPEKVKGAIPYFAELPVSAGESGLAEMVSTETPTGYMLIPHVVAKFLFPVVGCSMLPRIKPGDVIGVNPLERWDRVEPDKIYLIVTDEERMLKRLRPDDNDDTILWCISDNYKEFKIRKSEIRSLYHVTYHGELV